MLNSGLMTPFARKHADFQDPQASPFYCTCIALVYSRLTFCLSKRLAATALQCSRLTFSKPPSTLLPK